MRGRLRRLRGRGRRDHARSGDAALLDVLLAGPILVTGPVRHRGRAGVNGRACLCGSQRCRRGVAGEGTQSEHHHRHQHAGHEACGCATRRMCSGQMGGCADQADPLDDGADGRRRSIRILNRNHYQTQTIFVCLFSTASKMGAGRLQEDWGRGHGANVCPSNSRQRLDRARHRGGRRQTHVRVIVTARCRPIDGCG